jgi:uncharacterized damage-inducible protein DinB
MYKRLSCEAEGQDTCKQELHMATIKQMTNLAIGRPDPSEHDPYYSRYISLVPGNDVIATLATQIENTLATLRRIPEARGAFRYASGKWTIRQVVGHLADSERVFAYRALRISRNDKRPIEGFEQDDYVRYGPFEHSDLAGLVEEFAQIRAATLSLVRHLDEEAWTRSGTANNAHITVRALAWIIAGHELHHRGILERQYLAATA